MLRDDWRWTFVLWFVVGGLLLGALLLAVPLGLILGVSASSRKAASPAGTSVAVGMCDVLDAPGGGYCSFLGEAVLLDTPRGRFRVHACGAHRSVVSEAGARAGLLPEEVAGLFAPLAPPPRFRQRDGD